MLGCAESLGQQLRQALPPKGYDILANVQMSAGECALQAYAPDLIICELPSVLAAADFLSKLACGTPACQIPYIFLAEPASQVAARALLAEKDDLLVKPITGELLVLAIDACLVKRDYQLKIAGDTRNRLQTILGAANDLAGLIQTRLPPMAQTAGELPEEHARQAIDRLLRRHEKSILETGHELGALLDNIGIGIYRGTADPQGRLLHANLAMARTFGYATVEEYMKAPITSFYEDPEERRAFVEEIRRQGMVKCKCMRMHRIDGAKIWVEVTSRGHFDVGGDLIWVEGMLLDVTHKKQAEEALLAERNLLANLMEQMPDQIYFKDRDSRFTRINQHQAKVLGLAKPEDALGKTDYDFFDHASQSFADEQIIINTGRPLVNKTERVLTASGEHRWMSTTKAPLKDRHGEIIGLVGITRDIHEMKQAEEALAQRVRLAALTADISNLLSQEGELPSLLQNCSEAMIKHLDGAFARIWTLNDKDGLLELQASAGLYTNLRGAYSRLPVGQGMIGLIAQEKRPYVTNSITTDPRTQDPAWAARENLQAFTGYPLLVGERLVGVLAVFARHTLPIAMLSSLGGIAKSIAVGIERNHAVATLRKNEELFRLITENAADLIVVLDASGHRFYQSPSFQTVLGYSEEELAGLATFDLFHPDDRARVLAAIGQAFQSGQTMRLEYRVRHRDGSWRTIESTASLICGPEGMAEKMVAVARDITERKQAQVDLEKASRQAGMAEVASSVLHNVGNVLNSVNTSANVIRNRVRKLPVTDISKLAGLFETNRENMAGFLTQNNRAQQVTEFMRVLAQHLSAEQKALVEEIKDLSKNVDHIKDVVSMQQNYARVNGVVEKTNVADMIEDALRMHASALLRHDVHLVREFSPEVKDIVVEKHKALQILINLIHNAKIACDESHTPEKQLVVRTYPGGAGICIDIGDNGVGIPLENMPKIFNHGFTTRKNGHGFGLHSGALAAKEMGGTLQAFSDGPGKGATFTLSLPFEPKEQNRDLE